MTRPTTSHYAGLSELILGKILRDFEAASTQNILQHYVLCDMWWTKGLFRR